MHQTLKADGQLIARVASIQKTNPYAKAGLMIRQTLDGGSPHVILDVKPDGGVEFMSRREPNGETAFIAGAARSLPTWLRIARIGSAITGYVSGPTDTAWIQVGSITTSMSSDIEIGFAVTSHQTSALNTSVFDNIRLTTDGLPAPWAVQDVGDVGARGAATFSGGTFTVSGGGSDIWGSADSFTFVSQDTPSESGAFGALVARVTTIQNTNPYAKAGIMVRSSLAATSPSVILDVKPDGGIEFMSRMYDGGPTSPIASTRVDSSKPIWLQLTVDTQVTGWISTDGIGWTRIGTAAAPSVHAAGLAVTSHSLGVLNTSTFDQVTTRRGTPTSSSAWLWVMVVEQSGICIENATVEVVDGQAVGQRLTQKTPCGVWDYDGGAFFGNLTPGVAVTLRASAPGYVTKEQTFLPVPTPGGGTVQIIGLDPL